VFQNLLGLSLPFESIFIDLLKPLKFGSRDLTILKELKKICYA